MPRLVLILVLLLCPLLASAKPGWRGRSKEKGPTEVEAEWQTFRYYRARFASDAKVHKEEQLKEEKIRLVQNLPVAKDGQLVVSSGGVSAEPSSAVEAGGATSGTPSGVSAVEAPINPTSAIEAEKARLEEEKKAKEIEEAKTRLLGADVRDESGQVVDEDPTEDRKEDNGRRGLFRKKKDKKEEKEEE